MSAKPEKLTIADAERDGYSSLKLTLSNGTTAFVVAAGGDSNKANQENRDVILDALLHTIVQKGK